jgi:integrase
MGHDIKIRTRKDGKVARMQVEFYAIEPGSLVAERQRFTVPASITSKSGAVRWAEQARRDVEAGRPPPQTRKGKRAAAERKAKAPATSGLTVAEWCATWEASERALRVRETTLDTRRKALTLACTGTLRGGATVGSRPVAELGEAEVAAVRVAFAHLMASTANVYLGVVRQCMEAARVLGHRTTPLASLRVKSTEPVAERPHVEEEDGERFIEAAAQLGPRQLAALLLGLDAGLRSGEMVGLRVEDIDGEDLHVRRSIAMVKGQRTVFAPKSGKARILPMSPRLARVFDELAGASEDGWLLHQDDGTPAVRRQIETWLAQVVRRVGAEHVSPHGLRHGFASQVLRAGVDPKTVMALMGHASLATLEKYTHTTDRARRGAVSRLQAHRESVTNLTRVENTPVRATRKSDATSRDD